jgi:serine/threonine-protein kinase
MGTVYSGEHLPSRAPVAVKVLRPEHAAKKENVERVKQEARWIGDLRHENLCGIYDGGWLDDGCPYLVMELLRGETLAQRLERERSLPTGEVVQILDDVLAGIDAAHRRGVVHRDIKPDNIFLARGPSANGDDRWRAKVLDFGISKGVQERSHRLTSTGMVMGTPYYMAPEQALGERQLDGRVDVWGVGVAAYEALSGERPFVARNYNALLVQILTAEPRPLQECSPQVPRALCEIVHRALAKKADDRWPTAIAMQQALRSVGSSFAPRTMPAASAPVALPAPTAPVPPAPAPAPMGSHGVPTAGSHPSLPSPAVARVTPAVASIRASDERSVGGGLDDETTVVLGGAGARVDPWLDGDPTVVDDPPSFADYDSATLPPQVASLRPARRRGGPAK